MADRMKLVVIGEVGEPLKVGEKQIPKLSFKARNAKGDESQYFTFRYTLFDSIKKDAELDAEVEISSHDYDGNTYMDRKLTQIYVDGQPVGGQKQGKSWGKSPETIQLELNGKAKNTALMQACDMAKFEGTTDTAYILRKADEFYGWLQDKAESSKLKTEQPNPKDIAPVEPEDSPFSELPKDFDVAWLTDSLKKVKWMDSTVKSFCLSVYKTDKDGKPLDKTLKLVDYVASLKRADREAFFKEITDRLNMV